MAPPTRSNYQHPLRQDDPNLETLPLHYSCQTPSVSDRSLLRPTTSQLPPSLNQALPNPPPPPSLCTTTDDTQHHSSTRHYLPPISETTPSLRTSDNWTRYSTTPRRPCTVSRHDPYRRLRSRFRWLRPWRPHNILQSHPKQNRHSHLHHQPFQSRAILHPSSRSLWLSGQPLPATSRS